MTAERPRYDIERSCVRIVLRDRDGLILLLRAELASRAAGHWWELPGGGIEAGEGYAEAAAREIAEETGLVISPAEVGPPRWRRSATWAARGIRRLQHEVVVGVDLDASTPLVTAGGRTAEEREEYTGSHWWQLPDVLSSSERFYPGRLRELLPAFLAGAEIIEPFERWN
ncbi:MAG: NUDIX domain-containing protein [Streptosporangiaceae bacterium]